MKLLVQSLLVALVANLAVAAEWKPATGPLTTKWASDVKPDNVLPEYPRPQMVREKWQNLNGLWEYAIRPRDELRPSTFDGQILVPFAAESAFSGVLKPVGKDHRLWYRRQCDVRQTNQNERRLLHFGAVDWHATVWLNGQQVGEHRGGYDPFSLDITDALKKDNPQEIVVSIADPSDAGYQPRGKQVNEPKGIWYTSVTGIWQTVWLESVPATYVQNLGLTPDIDRSTLQIVATVENNRPGDMISATAFLNGVQVAAGRNAADQPLELQISNAKLWSPDLPTLYDLRVSITRDGKSIDSVTSYFGMRKSSLGKDAKGRLRMMLNNQPLFQYGPLDQGWWPDGLYTAPTDAALKYDVEVMKQLGFNAVRKHVKVEPDRWYYYCDKLGLLVWQDMPNGDRHIKPTEADITRSAESAENYRREWQAIIDSRRNHPCIVVWVPFNEGWGQFETDKILQWTKEYDPTRLVDGPSGWTDRGTGDMNDMHKYPGPDMPALEEKRATVLGEFGGLGLPLEGHLWWNKRNWGYRTYTSREELGTNYDDLMAKLGPLVDQGLSAAIYTQLTDVEGEVNGLLTYDRQAIKFDAEKLARQHRELIGQGK